jgi:hypothetical protein
VAGGRARRRARKDRRRARFELQFHSPGFVYFTHCKPCVVPGCHDRQMNACHWRSRAAGGTWRDIYPGCHGHHMEQERGFTTFERKYGLDLRASAARLVSFWEALSDEERAWWEQAADEAGYKWPGER